MSQKTKTKQALKTAVLYLSFALVCGATLDTAIIKAILAVQFPHKATVCEIATSTIEVIATTTQATIKALTPRQIFEQKTAHLDSALVAEMDRVIDCESKWNPTAKNPTSTASGLAQFISRTWRNYCQGDVMDAGDNLDCFVKLYPEHKGWWACYMLVS